MNKVEYCTRCKVVIGSYTQLARDKKAPKILDKKGETMDYPRKSICNLCDDELKLICEKCYNEDKFPCSCKSTVDTRCIYCGCVAGINHYQHYNDVISNPRGSPAQHIIDLAEHNFFNYLKQKYPQEYIYQFSNLKSIYAFNQKQMIHFYGFPERFYLKNDMYDFCYK